MNIAAIAQAAFRSLSSDVTQRVTFTDDDGNTTSGTCTAVAGSAGFADDLDAFRAGAMVSEKTRRLTLLPDGLAWTPKEGYRAELEDETVWTVVGCTPLAPGGSVIAYRVKLVR